MTPEDITKLLRIAEIVLNEDNSTIALDFDEIELQRLKDLLAEHFKQ